VAEESNRLGLVLGSQNPPEEIADLARLGESLGFGELWIAEDYFFTGGIACATAALAATERIPVGLGVVSGMVRHPAVLAMECSSLARMFPGRFWPGVGLGLPGWIAQMGLSPRSQLRAFRECLEALRELLGGAELNRDGASFAFDGVQLAYPVMDPVPIYAGALGPRMLELTGSLADGTIGSIFASVAYVRWARERIAAGRAEAGRTGHHRLACFAVCSVAEDGEDARAALRPVMAFYLSVLAKSPLLEIYGITEDVAALMTGGVERLAAELPDEWLNDLAVVGDPEECAEQIRRLLDAGCDSVALFPLPADRSEAIVRLAAKEVLPRVQDLLGP
jgi:alkanesulfonate monooxygenase SsuD/methylene tetrahydromethanopterin reductase-like flavin-dependent oxidoreductase (luciferase family)